MSMEESDEMDSLVQYRRPSIFTKLEIKPSKPTVKIINTNTEEECKCMKIIGHLESVKWMVHPRKYRPSPGLLGLGDWTTNPFIWLYHVERSDGILADDDVLLAKAPEYQEINDVSRYFTGDQHCGKVLFTYQYPNLKMPTPLGNYLYRANIALKVQSNLYRKELQNSIELTLKKMVLERAQMDRLIVSDGIIKLDKLDYFRREAFFRLLCNVISFQDRLQLVSFENMCCSRLEGVNLINHLACFNAHSLKYLFLWRFVLPNENPILVNYKYITGSGQYIPRPNSRYTFLRSLGELRNLRYLALEYAHIADGTGEALLYLLPVIKRPHFRLQLICREDQIPGRTDGSLGVGGYDIPDTAWRRVAIACPDIYLLFAFFRIRDYDNVRRFLTPSIPLREVHLQYGIDLKMQQRQDSDVSCFIRHLAYRYANTLITLSIHQWRFATFPLHHILQLMPNLVRLFYVGTVEDKGDLTRLLKLISYGVCKDLKQIKIQIQDDENRVSYWKDAVESLTEQFADVMQLLEIKFCLSVYKS
nr:uncharacterized protein LOC110374236 [Helicoverpa armigera]